jgi:hypothetical protein
MVLVWALVKIRTCVSRPSARDREAYTYTCNAVPARNCGTDRHSRFGYEKMLLAHAC